jgi:hypothetical protein
MYQQRHVPTKAFNHGTSSFVCVVTKSHTDDDNRQMAALTHKHKHNHKKAPPMGGAVLGLVQGASDPCI